MNIAKEIINKLEDPKQNTESLFLSDIKDPDEKIDSLKTLKT